MRQGGHLLVLTRKVGEAIAIGDDVKVVVMQIKGRQVRLGIKAGPATVVHREEIYQKIKDENELASSASAGALDAASKAWKEQATDSSDGAPAGPGGKSTEEE